MIPRYGLAVLILIALAPVGPTGCARARVDPVSGKWTGAWYRSGERPPAGRLSFRITPEARGTWRAVVETASEDIETSYELTLRGRREGARVVFDGEVDLGRAGGGVYEWTGEVDGQVFQGGFKHPAGDGRFELVRRPEPESIVPPESSAAAAADPSEP